MHGNSFLGYYYTRWSKCYIPQLICDILQIYFVDIQVWYTVISALLGGLEGARDKLGEASHSTMIKFLLL
jgi:hypothetical protein